MLKNYEIPEIYRCSITAQIMIDPVTAADGYTYEREAIEQWLQIDKKSPKTNLPLANKHLIDNHDKRSEILTFLESHSELYEEDVYMPKAWIAQCVTAIKGNQLSDVRRWVDRDRRLLTGKLEGEYTALHLACEFGSPELVDMLLMKILKQRNKPIMPGALGFKSVHLNVLLESAVSACNYLKCELLLKMGADIEQPEAFTQNTLLHRSIIRGNTNLTAFLLERNANPEARNAEQKSPFYMAIEKGNIKAATILVTRDANPAVSCELTELSVLHVAVERSDVDVLRYLLGTGAIVLIDAQNARGDTPLHLAIQAENSDIIVHMLLESGANHKIKNKENQTPIELARLQGQAEIADTLVTTARALKQLRLEQVNKMQQNLAKQAREIEDLKAAFQRQSQWFHSQLSDMQAKMELLEPLLPPAISTPQAPLLKKLNSAVIFSPLGLLQPAHIHLSAADAPRVNPKDIGEFLMLVARGEQDAAEGMLKNNQALALSPGDVVDLSNRTFTGITGFQYAVWALDWHMWTMIRKYLPDEAAKQQAEAFETSSWVHKHGVFADVNMLIQAYQNTFTLYNNPSKQKEGDIAWVQQVGKAQLLLPAHIVNEYCHPTRLFNPCPNFNEALDFPRNRKIEAEEEWFSADKVGETFAMLRGTAPEVCKRHIAKIVSRSGSLLSAAQTDYQGVCALNKIRISQRKSLIVELSDRSDPVLSQLILNFVKKP